MPADTEAALQWLDYEQTLCPGCGLSRADTMAPMPADWHPELPDGLRRARWAERYDVDTVECPACAARDRKAYNLNAAERNGHGPAHAGIYFAIHEEEGLNG